MLKYENAWLNSRILIVSEAFEGPPWVITKMMSKVFRASMDRNRMATIRVGRRRGRVINQKHWKGLAPSMRADSYGSLGRAARPARAMSMMRGVHSHTSTKAMAYRAVLLL